MSEENVEVVRRWFKAANEEPDDMRASVSSYWDADADYYPARKFPEARPCHGPEAISNFLIRFMEAWSGLEWTVEEAFEVSGDRVLVRAGMRSEGRESGMSLDGDVYRCFWVRHGLFFRVEDHLTLKGALQALGLPGETLEAAGLRE